MRLMFVLAGLLAFAHAVLADDIQQQGEGLLQLVLADRGFAAELTLPAVDLVGFDHSPRNDGERAALSLAIALLETPDAVLTTNQEAGCSGNLLAVESPLLTLAADAGTEKGEAAHNKVLARYRYSCSNMAALTNIELGLLRQLKRLERVELQWLSANNGGSGQLTPQTPSFTLLSRP